MRLNQLLVAFLHTIIFGCSFIPYTTINRGIKKGDYLCWIPYFINYLVMIVTNILTVRSPYYVAGDDVSISLGDNMQFCRECNNFCPVRAVHCKKCKRCIWRKDHHCTMLGQCIGMGNHLSYLLFLVAIIIFDLHSIRIYQHSIRDETPPLKWLYTSLPCSICLFASYLSIIQPIFLLPFHIFLISVNKTTYEFLKGSKAYYLKDWKYYLSPFSKGIIGNYIDFLTMARRRPVYRLPSTDKELDEWLNNNSCITNQAYELC